MEEILLKKEVIFIEHTNYLIWALKIISCAKKLIKSKKTHSAATTKQIFFLMREVCITIEKLTLQHEPCKIFILVA